MLGTPSFSQPYLCIQPAVQSPPKICSLIQSIFTFLFYSYLFTKSSLKPPLTILSFIPQQFLTSLFLRITIPAIHTKIFSSDIMLTITNSVSHRLRKLIYCRCEKPSNSPSLIPYIYCHYFHTLLIPPNELLFP